MHIINCGGPLQEKMGFKDELWKFLHAVVQTFPRMVFSTSNQDFQHKGPQKADSGYWKNTITFIRAIQSVFLFCSPRARFLEILYSREIQGKIWKKKFFPKYFVQTILKYHFLYIVGTYARFYYFSSWDYTYRTVFKMGKGVLHTRFILVVSDWCTHLTHVQ